MANQEQLVRLQTSGEEHNGCQTWNRWRKLHSAITTIDLSFADLRRASLKGANLNRANLHRTNLRGASLKGATLIEANLHEADLNDANLQGANLSHADVSGADLHWARLQRVNLTHANLDNANLGSARLDRAKLCNASLNQSDLSRAVLNHADLSQALLSRATLQKTDLSYAILTGATLHQANLNAAFLCEATLLGADLSEATLEQSGGEPFWPEVEMQERLALEYEASNPATTPERLTWLAGHWPGCVTRELIAANPNIPIDLLRSFATEYPIAVLSNSVLPLLFLEQPHWLAARDAQWMLDRVSSHSARDQIRQRYDPLLYLIEQCAHEQH